MLVLQIAIFILSISVLYVLLTYKTVDCIMCKYFKRKETMPLKSGKSNKTRNSNIKEVIKSYETKGTIGTSKPKTKAKAIKQAVAIGYAEQKRSPKKKK